MGRTRRQTDHQRLLGARRVPDAAGQAAGRPREAVVRRGTRPSRSRTPRCSAASCTRDRASRPVGEHLRRHPERPRRWARSASRAPRSSATSGCPRLGRRDDRRVRADRTALGLRLARRACAPPPARRRRVGAQRRQALDRQRHVRRHHDHLGEATSPTTRSRASSSPPRPRLHGHKIEGKTGAAHRAERRHRARRTCVVPEAHAPAERATRSATPRACCGSPAPTSPGPRSATRSAPTRRPSTTPASASSSAARSPGTSSCRTCS